MAVINLNIGDIIEDCPNLTIPDSTDYAGTTNTFLFSDFKFHDYTQGLPVLNGTLTFDTFNLGGVYPFTGVSIQVLTDGAGNILNPLAQYEALVSALNAASVPEVNVELVQPADTGYRDWYLRFSATEGNLIGQAVTVNTSGGSITPLLTAVQPNVIISNRNLTLLDKDGNPIDIGAVKQVEQWDFTGPHAVGDEIVSNFCGDIVTYTVENGETSPECVAMGFAQALMDSTGGLWEKYAEVSFEGARVTVVSKEAGIPLQINTTYNGGVGPFTQSTPTGNVSSMANPSAGFSVSDEVVYETAERGGKYTAILTVVANCVYNTVEREFFSWCYDISNFDCCFVELVKNGGCSCKSKDKVLDASTIRNILISLPKMIEKGESESRIQKVVDMGWSICGPLDCGCSNC